MSNHDAEPEKPAGSETPVPGADQGAWAAGPGARLLAERRNQGLSLGDIARQLKLSVRQVEALERDDYSGFAGPVFIRGFLRNYAKLLRMDPEPLLEAAELAVVSPVVQAEQLPAGGAISVAGSDRGRRILAATALAVLAVAAVVLLASNAARERHEQQPAAPGPSLALQTPAASPPHPESPPADSSAPAASQAAPSTASPPAVEAVVQPHPPVPESPTQAKPALTGAVPGPAHPDVAQATPTAVPGQPRVLVSGSGPVQIHLVFEDESWVEIKDGSGVTIYSRLNGAGTERVVKGTPPFSVVVGIALGVKVRYMDKAVDLGPHTRVDVARVTLE